MPVFLSQLSIVSALILFAGCDRGTAPVKVDLARETLTTVMDCWKEGKSQEDLAPRIIVQDMDWTSGAELLDYEKLDDDRPINSNLYARVKLKLRFPNETESTKIATYVVSTSPGLTVFRDMMK